MPLATSAHIEKSSVNRPCRFQRFGLTLKFFGGSVYRQGNAAENRCMRQTILQESDSSAVYAVIQGEIDGNGSTVGAV